VYIAFTISFIGFNKKCGVFGFYFYKGLESKICTSGERSALKREDTRKKKGGEGSGGS
jgi:hypothetical protein